MPARHCFQYAKTYSVAGSDLSADRSICSNSEQRLAPRWRVTRLLICSTQARIAALSSAREKNVCLRSFAMIHRVATCTPTSTFGFILRFFGTRWDYCGVVMVRHLLIRTIDVRLVEAGFGDARFQIVADDHRRHAAKVSEGALVRADPIGERLRPGRFRVCQRRSTKNRDEQFGREDLASDPINDLQLRAGVIDKHPLAGDMRLAHRRRDQLLPGSVQVAKTRVRVPAEMFLAILLPEQLQRDARPLQLAMDLRPIR